MKRKSILFTLVTIPFFIACGGESTNTSISSESSKNLELDKKGSNDKGSKDNKGSKGSENKGSNDKYHTNDIPVALPSSYTPDAGQLLGAQCAQCHGTNGVSVNKWDSIAGEDDLHKEMFEYENTHIMTAQARGYTPEEVNLMEAWLQTLTKYKD